MTRTPPPPSPLSDDAFSLSLRPLYAAVEAAGFSLDDAQPQPTWTRARADASQPQPTWAEKVVLWRHPRLPWEVHGHVASSRSPHALHLRFFDPNWKPSQILPGHWEKGFSFDSPPTLTALTQRLTEVIWPRALTWFEAPCSAEDILGADARVLSLIRPGPLLDEHRARVSLLTSQGRLDEAHFVRSLIAYVEALFPSPP